MENQMQRSLMIFIALLSAFRAGGQTANDSYVFIDSLSQAYYARGEWQNMNKLGAQNDICSFGSNKLLQRFAHAAFISKNYRLAEKWAWCAYKLSSTDTHSLQILYNVRLKAGDIRNVLFLGQSLGYFRKGFCVVDAGLEGGFKFSKEQEPGNFSHAGVHLGIRFGRRLFADQFFSVNTQDYFREDFSQYNYTFVPEIYFTPRLSLLLPFQAAKYKSSIAYTDSSYAPELFAINGNVTQHTNHISAMLRFRQGHFDIQGGASCFLGKTQTGYDVIRDFEGQQNLVNTVNLDSVTTQYQANALAQVNFDFKKQRVFLGMQNSLLNANGTTYLNARPFFSAELTKNLRLYGEFWHKGNYMISNPSAGILINNTHTTITRYLLMLSYSDNKRIKIDLTGIRERVDDRLYARQFKNNGLFLNLNFYFAQ